jgi:hypothetical protein
MMKDKLRRYKGEEREGQKEERRRRKEEGGDGRGMIGCSIRELGSWRWAFSVSRVAGHQAK